jgi:hypothetical protein
MQQSFLDPSLWDHAVVPESEFVHKTKAKTNKEHGFPLNPRAKLVQKMLPHFVVFSPVKTLEMKIFVHPDQKLVYIEFLLGDALQCVAEFLWEDVMVVQLGGRQTLGA